MNKLMVLEISTFLSDLCALERRLCARAFKLPFRNETQNAQLQHRHSEADDKTGERLFSESCFTT